MKTILTLAAAVATFATASAVSAHDATGGHWEWRTQPSYGPKSAVPSRIQVWVKDGASTMANCDCSMMKADASDCMMDMSGKGRAPSAG
ncbi:MAG: hypothetical protein LKG22_00325 [Sphingobium sp.]|mgnify:CR=1 FL=1|jgi:hypothetical protein|nr:hypothetical protein [Sphingobium sp.]